MAEEFQGGVCGGTWWNPPRSFFSGGAVGGLTSPCSVAQLGAVGGGFDMPMPSLVFPADMDSTFDILGFGISPTSSTTTDWSQPSHLCSGVGHGGNNFGSILLEDENLKMTSSNIMNDFDASPPMAGTASSGSPADSSTITSEGGLINTSFPMCSSTSYLIQTLFDDSDESQVIEPQLPMNPNYGCVMSSNELLGSTCSWVKPSSPNTAPTIQPPAPSPQLGQNTEFHGGMNMLVNSAMNGQFSNPAALSNIRASLLNSLKSRSRTPAVNNQKSQSCDYLATKVTKEEVCNSKGSMNDQPQAKRPRIETPSPLPTFKVRKEKLGDRITALQQLVSPFGKTDTASVLHEAIEYIKFLHDQVSALSTPYLKNGATMQQQQEAQEGTQDLQSKGLCLVPISSTYPVVQETPVDFWTPTFGGPAFR